MNRTPITVFTGYLGSGKTTIIINLIKQVSDDYKIVWLKNEYGDVNVDAVLAEESNIKMKEMLNGCLCCVLVGRLHDALLEIQAEYQPDRIFVESSGTAYPLPIVLEINRIPELRLDGVINVIDAVNFDGYKDKGKVAEMQSKYTDLIIINKTKGIPESELDDVLDDVYELNPNTPKLRTEDGMLDKEVLLGIDSKFAELQADGHDEHSHDNAHEHEHGNHPDEVETFSYKADGKFSKSDIETILEPLKQQDFIRIKGVVDTADGFVLLNWVFGKLEWEPLSRYKGQSMIIFMGRRGTSRLESKILDQLESGKT